MNWEQLFNSTGLNPYEILDNIHKKNTIIYPQYNNTFKAFELCPLDKLKVAINLNRKFKTSEITFFDWSPKPITLPKKIILSPLLKLDKMYFFID